MVDLVIAGGGPAGLAVAIRAGMEGLSVVVLEAADPPIDRACGEGLLPDGVRTLVDLGVDVEGLESRPIAGIRFLDGELSAEGTFPSGTGLGIRRTVLHDLLRRRAEAVGAKLCWGRRAVGLLREAIVTEDGPVRGKWLVGADGRSSRMRRWAEINGRMPRRRRIGIRRHFEVEPWTDLVEIYWARDCEAYVTPVADRLIDVAILASDAGPGFDGLLARFTNLAERLDGAPHASSVRGSGPFGLKVRKVVENRVVLVGDASGSLDAISGDGVTRAFLHAISLVDAVKCGEIDRYARAHRSIDRSPRLTTELLLVLQRAPRFRRRVMRSLNHDPSLVQRFLSLKQRRDGPLLGGADGLAALCGAALWGR